MLNGLTHLTLEREREGGREREKGRKGERERGGGGGEGGRERVDEQSIKFKSQTLY